MFASARHNLMCDFDFMMYSYQVSIMCHMYVPLARFVFFFRALPLDMSAIARSSPAPRSHRSRYFAAVVSTFCRVNAQPLN